MRLLELYPIPSHLRPGHVPAARRESCGHREEAWYSPTRSFKGRAFCPLIWLNCLADFGINVGELHLNSPTPKISMGILMPFSIKSLLRSSQAFTHNFIFPRTHNSRTSMRYMSDTRKNCRVSDTSLSLTWTKVDLCLAEIQD